MGAQLCRKWAVTHYLGGCHQVPRPKAKRLRACAGGVNVSPQGTHLNRGHQISLGTGSPSGQRVARCPVDRAPFRLVLLGIPLFPPPPSLTALGPPPAPPSRTTEPEPEPGEQKSGAGLVSCCLLGGCVSGWTAEGSRGEIGPSSLTLPAADTPQMASWRLAEALLKGVGRG